jgi:hypothetical protein
VESVNAGRRPLSTEAATAFSKGVLLPDLIAALEELLDTVNWQEFFARKAAPSRVAFFVHGERFRNSNPDGFAAMRQIDEWTDATCTVLQQ